MLLHAEKAQKSPSAHQKSLKFTPGITTCALLTSLINYRLCLPQYTFEEGSFKLCIFFTQIMKFGNDCALSEYTHYDISAIFLAKKNFFL